MRILAFVLLAGCASAARPVIDEEQRPVSCEEARARATKNWEVDVVALTKADESWRTEVRVTDDYLQQMEHTFALATAKRRDEGALTAADRSFRLAEEKATRARDHVGPVAMRFHVSWDARDQDLRSAFDVVKCGLGRESIRRDPVPEQIRMLRVYASEVHRSAEAARADLGAMQKLDPKSLIRCDR